MTTKDFRCNKCSRLIFHYRVGRNAIFITAKCPRCKAMVKRRIEVSNDDPTEPSDHRAPIRKPRR